MSAPNTPRSADGTPLTGVQPLILGREAFKRHDDASELMNIDGRALGTPEVLWNGDDTAWTAGDTGSSTTGSKKNGVNGWDTGVTAENDKTTFDNGSMASLSGKAELRFWIQPKAFPVGSKPKIFWVDDGGSLVGVRLRIDNYTENMDLDVWQRVAIPIDDFALTGDVQKLKIKYTNTAGQDYWFDDIELIPTGNGPFRFEFAAPDATVKYHVSMLVLMVAAPKTGWNHDAFANIIGGLDNGLILRHKHIEGEDSGVLWKFVAKSNMALFGLFHPQEDVMFADDVLLFGFMVKPGKASIIVTDDDILQFVVRDDLTDISEMRAYVHFGVEVVS